MSWSVSGQSFQRTLKRNTNDGAYGWTNAGLRYGDRAGNLTPNTQREMPVPPKT